ncbi:NAD(P) transhydrogenase subunit alpha [Klebsiella pneumoniae]|uniref:proton-translocating NAD(P)(+) transhydrogenase n=1 Tax=Klebsiella pneumoniae TaxID=573 RepID=A0A2X3CM48_KLEPN|nr:NAD(P) transhydrogenase subunit alpha [Klebsiella pneumoniae]
MTGDEVWQSDVILKVNAPNDDEIALLNPGTTLISFIWPAQNPQLMEKLAARNIKRKWRWIPCRVFPAPSRWMRSAQWPTSPGTALSLKRRMNLVDSLPGRLRRQARFRPPR